MQLLNDLIPFGLGLCTTLFLTAFIHVRAEIRHAGELNDEWESGRKHGYHQCYSEMVLPLRAGMTPTKNNRPLLPPDYADAHVEIETVEV